MWGRVKERGFCPDPHHVGGKRKAPVRTPEEHRKAVAALSLPPEPKPAKDHRLGKEGFKRVLREMGYSCYAEYLQSDTWMRIRRRVLKKAKGRCSDCPSAAAQVHHEEYTVENLKGKSYRFLEALCDDCHHRRHGLQLRGA